MTTQPDQPPRIYVRKIGDQNWHTTCLCPYVSHWSSCSDFTLALCATWETALWHAHDHAHNFHRPPLDIAGELLDALGNLPIPRTRNPNGGLLAHTDDSPLPPEVRTALDTAFTAVRRYTNQLLWR